jgi:cytochrome c-type biogenesis protein CcmH/NrfG
MAGFSITGKLQNVPRPPKATNLLQFGQASHLSNSVRLLPTPSLARPQPQTLPKANLPPHTLYERGLTCAAMDDFAAAIDALREATELAPGHGAAWAKLAELLAQTGNSAAADHAARSRDQAGASSTPKPPRPRAPAKLEAAERQLRASLHGDTPDSVARVLRQHLLENPTDAAALLLLAQTIMQQGRVPEATRLLARALDLAPTYSLARHLYAVCLFRQGKEISAIPQIERLLAQDPRNIAYRTLLASSLAMTGQTIRSIGIYQELIKEAPKRVDLWLSYAQALQHAGRREDSKIAFRTILGFAPATGQAHWSLQDLSTEKPTDEDLAAMRANLASGALTPEARFHFEYALAYALEKSAAYGESFAHYAAGAKLRRQEIGYDPEDITERVRRTQALFADRANQGNPDPAPIFIVGMPRAGSTLIEQILATHSAVEGTKELPELGHLVEELSPRVRAGTDKSYLAQAYPECLLAAGPDALAEIGRRYIDRTRIYRVTDRPFFIDKMPANWIDTGLIALILPNAKIIDARRDPMATCFAAFKKYFSKGQSFTYDLNDLGRYYNDYADLMAHFDAVAPGRVHRVIYENMVADTEAEIRRLLDYCGLDFEPACLRFWETKRVVSTASSEQVRRPIFRDGLDQWRNFEPWLDPLKQALGRYAFSEPLTR